MGHAFRLLSISPTVSRLRKNCYQDADAQFSYKLPVLSSYELVVMYSNAVIAICQQISGSLLHSPSLLQQCSLAKTLR